MNMKELRDIPGFEGKYAVTEDGQVWSYQSKKFMKIANGNNGYKQVCLTLDKNRSKNFYIHRLVALAYLPNPANLTDVNHIDENKANNHVSNLEWCSHHFNIKHSSYKLCKPVYCIELDRVFESEKAAAEYLGCNSALVTIACKNPQWCARKHHFRFVEEKK